MSVNINQKQLQKILSNIGNCRFVSLVVETTPKLKAPKTNGLLDSNGNSRIVKRSKVVVSTGDSLSYQSVVNRRLKVSEQPIVEVKPRQWGERVPNTPFVINSGKLYLETLINSVSSTQYFMDGKEVQKEDIKDWLGDKPNTDTYGLNDNQPIWRDYALTSIKEVVTDGVTYHVD